MGPAILVPIGMVATWGTTVAVAESIRDNSQVPAIRGKLVAEYRLGYPVKT